MLVPHATPFFYPGGPTGCLLIHGFTGSPKEVEPLGEYLAGQGYTALGIRLFAHATSPQDMNRAHWQDWVASVEDGWHILQGATEHIFIIGLSMGGVLALYHAARLEVAGAVALSTPYKLVSDPRLALMKYVWRLMPFIKKEDPDWHDATQMEEHFSYDMYPTHSVYELIKLLEEMRSVLDEINVPTLLMHSKNDLGVPPENMSLIYNDLRLPEDKKRKVWFENSGHILTRDLEKDRVFAIIHRFLEENQPGPAGG